MFVCSVWIEILVLTAPRKYSCAHVRFQLSTSVEQTSAEKEVFASRWKTELQKAAQLHQECETLHERVGMQARQGEQQQVIT